MSRIATGRRRVLAGLATGGIAAAVLLGALSASAGAAVCDNYTGPSPGAWSTIGNWSTNAVPTSGQIACLGGSIVDVTASESADSVTGGSLVITAGTLTLGSSTDNSSLVNLSLDDTGNLTAAAQTVNVSGNFEWGTGGDSTVLDTTLSQTGGGTFAIDGSGLGGPSMTGGASISTTSPVSISNANFGFNGDAQTLLTTSTITLSAGEQITSLSGNSTITAASIASQASSNTYGFWGGNLVLSGGTTTVATNTTLQAGTLTLENATLDDNSGIAAGSGYTLSTTIDSGSTFAGVGNIAGAVTNVAGTVAPPYGASGNQLTMAGSYTQDAGGTLAVGMDGNDTSLLRVFGAMTLAGDLTVTDELGFTPSTGEQFDVILSGSGPTGTFATVDGPSASEYATTYATDVVRLTAGAVVVTPPAGGVPTITGTPSPGQTLTCQHGTWSGSPTGYTYQWNLDGTAVTAAATTDTFVIPSADAGHALTCTVVASNGGGPGTPATSAPVTVSSPGPTTTPTGPTPTPTLGVPVDTVLPVVSGTPTPGHTLSCTTGTWTNSPTGYRYQWARGGVALPAAVSHTYAVLIADEGSTLTCTVVASNAAGAGAPATSIGVVVAMPGTLHCPKPTGSLGGVSVGPFALGFTRAHARHTLKRYQVTANNFDNFCLYGGWGIRVGYPSSRILGAISAGERARVSGKIVLALSANPYYALHGVRPGAVLTAVAKHLGVGKAFHIGSNYWYLAPAGSARGVVKVRGGVIQEVGLANKQLTAGSRTAQHAFLASFTGA
ncbi:MAG TPA: hypothetical protein VG186_15060 [Solirubrobacteraceae bacterium]|jgi:hypothetical protein|nr:hypothetical protein [Solirubrobacteraceae bacterium]